MRARRLVMLRHGQTEYNAGSRMQGQLDTDLTDLGRDQAVAAAEVLAKRQPLVIVSSDLRRALDAAVCLGERSGMPVVVDTRLRETHLGDWQGKTHLEVDAVLQGERWPQSLDQLAKLDVVEACAHETMRLKPVAPIIIQQKPREKRKR